VIHIKSIYLFSQIVSNSTTIVNKLTTVPIAQSKTSSATLFSDIGITNK
jgi:hypothetical protein